MTEIVKEKIEISAGWMWKMMESVQSNITIAF